MNGLRNNWPTSRDAVARYQRLAGAGMASAYPPCPREPLDFAPKDQSRNFGRDLSDNAAWFCENLDESQRLCCRLSERDRTAGSLRKPQRVPALFLGISRAGFGCRP